MIATCRSFRANSPPLVAVSVSFSSNWKSLSAIRGDFHRGLARQVIPDLLEHGRQFPALALADAFERDVEHLERQRLQMIEQRLAARRQIKPPRTAIAGIGPPFDQLG